PQRHPRSRHRLPRVPVQRSRPAHRCEELLPPAQREGRRRIRRAVPAAQAGHHRPGLRRLEIRPAEVLQRWRDLRPDLPGPVSQAGRGESRGPCRVRRPARKTSTRARAGRSALSTPTTRDIAMSRRISPVIPGFGLTLGYTLVYLSLLVLIPLGAMFVHAAQLSWDQFWAIISAPRVLAALKLSFATALAAAVLNGIIGTLLAWVLVRYSFPGRKVDRKSVV